MDSVRMKSSFFILSLFIFAFAFAVSRDTPLFIPSERETLLKLKHNLTDPFNRLSSWNNASVNSNCCHWAGVVCNNVTAHVVQLHLNTTEPDFVDYQFDAEGFDKAWDVFWRSQLGGEINPCLADLKHLNYLDLSGNELHGEGKSIPAFLGAITSLTHLDLSYAGFYGKIPSQIGNLSNLVYLDLSYTVNGTIPSQIGNLSNLVYLNLRNSRLFVENVDWLSRLSKLEYLDLRGANLSKAFYWLHTLQALPSLTNLSLSYCTLPFLYSQPYALNFSSLLTLDMSEVYYPFFPKWIFGLTKLISLDFSSNIIKGPIPDGIQNLTLLQTLDLSYNSFSSSIPDSLYSLRHLKFLNLERNNLNGSISNALGNLIYLIELDLSHNHLEGTIPTSLESLTSLVQLDLSHNHLSGNLTDQIGNLEKVVKLDFSFNSIGGTLPISFGKLSSLKYLDLSKNHFTGNPFESLKSLCKLSNLDITDNHFQGVINENDLANLTSLERFYASGGNFTLKVSPNWHLTSQLTDLDMREWQLGPNFPSWIQSQNKLRHVEMSHAGIFDYIPSWFWKITSQADFVNLSHNQLHGELRTTLRNPISIENVVLSTNHLSGKLPYLSNYVKALDLSCNSFSGSMHDFLCKNQDKQMQLAFLNLASNNLSREMPDCWISWPILVDVNLQSNRFVGNFPPSMGSLVELQSIQIRNNSLSGIFPTSLKENKKLIMLDLGENNLSGTIPLWIGEKFKDMRVLRFRSNNFSGHIPNKICGMNHLQVLDLAHNNLYGRIPSCLNHLNAMTIMNKSTSSFIYCSRPRGYRFFAPHCILSEFLWLKGREDEYKNFLGLVTSIDLSSNKLSGEIPRQITNLNGLTFLNLSHNQLIGYIPQRIGNMRSLLSIDFSRNQLSGVIPPTISNLSFLSQLDLSYNNLKGKIPIGTQLQTFDASNFIGNNLCGPPLPVNCISNGKIHSYDHKGKRSHRHRVNWLFVCMTFGFIAGFWIVIGPLFICRSWRDAYFDILDYVWFKLQSFC